MNTQAKLSGWSLGIGIAIGLAAGLVIPALTHHRHPPGGPPAWIHSHELSDAEKAHVREIAEGRMSKDKEIFHRLEDLSEKLRGDLADPKANDEQLRKQFAEVNDLRHTMALKRFDLDLEVRNYVGPARIKLFDPIGPPMPPPPPEHHEGDRPRDDR